MSRNIAYSKNSYSVLTFFKYAEVILKKFFKFYLFSKNELEKRYFKERLGFIGSGTEQGKKTVLFHTVSLGELNAALPLIELLKKEMPGVNIVVTTNNNSSYLKGNKKSCIDRVIFSPYDMGLIINRVLDKILPGLIIIVDGDFWPNFLKCAKKRSIPVVVISGRFNLIRPFYGYNVILTKEVLENIDYFGMRSQKDADGLARFLKKDSHIKVTGDLKFSGIGHTGTISSTREFLGLLNNFSKKIIVAGSTHEGEEEIILEAYRVIKEQFPDSLLILAPRDIARVNKIADLCKALDKKFERRSSIDKLIEKKTEIIILDTEGELFEIYSASKCAFLGGSLVYIDRFGGHNILEPAFFGKPIIFGPYMHNFQYLADEFIKRGIGFKVANFAELRDVISKLFTDDELVNKIFQNEEKYFKENSYVLQNSFNLVSGFIRNFL